MCASLRKSTLVTLAGAAAGLVGLAATAVSACPPISPVCTTDITSVGHGPGGCIPPPNGITNAADAFVVVNCMNGVFEPLCGGVGTTADVCDINCDGAYDECDLRAVLCRLQGTPCCDLACDPPTAAPPPFDVPKNRYISFASNSGLTQVAYEVVRTTGAFPGPMGYVGAPDAMGISSVVPDPVVMVWPPVVDVGDCEIIPGESYEIGFEPSAIPAILPVAVDTTPVWCDIVGVLSPITLTWTPPNGVVNFNDVQAALQAFLGVATAPDVTVSDLQAVSSADSCLNRLTNIADVFRILLTFGGVPYPFELDPSLCPANTGPPACLP